MTKTISLADDAYDLLAAAKRPGESFSDVTRRLAKRDRQRLLFDPDVRLDLDEEEAKEWTKRIYAERERSRPPRYQLP